MKVLLLFLAVSVQRNAGSILTEEQFARIPPMVHADRFAACVNQEGGVYCTASAVLVAEQQSELYDLMDNYSRKSPRHYNYTNILYGLCISDRCKRHYEGGSPPELARAAEACLNETLAPYGLQARVYNNHCYKHNDDRHKVDALDKFAANCFFGLIAVIVLATAYDLATGKKGEEGVLLSFSLRGNWDRLKEPPTTHPRKSLLLGMNGIRFITTVLIMFGHAPIPPLSFPANPQWVEYASENKILQSLFQGHVITLTFFTLSGFLMTYNAQVLRETRTMDWRMLPKGVLVRWLRLAPVNITILLLTATWFRFTDLGPFYQETIGSESEDCRKHWLAHVLYLNNYVDKSVCNIQSWSIAVDMQLHILGLMIILLSPSVKFRNRLLLSLFLVGMILPAIETYTRDLDGTLLVAAEKVRTYFTNDDTFQHTYKRTHTNIPCFVLGMALGYLVYDWHTGAKQVPPRLRQLLSATTWLLFPLMFAVSTTTFLLFMQDGPRRPLAQRVLYSILQKPAFGLLIALVIVSCVIRAEKVVIYRRILEWPLWSVLTRLSYCMFAVHVSVLRYLGGTKETTTHLSFPHLFHDFCGLALISMLFGFILYMLVEAPFGQLVKVLLVSGPKSKRVAHSNGTTVLNGGAIHSNGGVFSNGGHKTIGSVNQSNGNVKHSNGNVMHSNGNVMHSNGNVMHSNGNAIHSNGNVIYSNGNVIHSNGNGIHKNGNAYSNGNAVLDGKHSVSNGKQVKSE